MYVQYVQYMYSMYSIWTYHLWYQQDSEILRIKILEYFFVTFTNLCCNCTLQSFIIFLDITPFGTKITPRVFGSTAGASQFFSFLSEENISIYCRHVYIHSTAISSTAVSCGGSNRTWCWFFQRACFHDT